ncbi:MAG: metallophosphatase family protein [Kiritimatiellae bacterium]|nr:metallophosphatase family protein [Kiritimatiellia bacterium]MDW8457555.1 metallophosphoesterase family protein [Verrucomicrobiota bacterium]
MRLAVLSDIHGNFIALRAVLDAIDRDNPDRVIIAGDVINRGPRSRECLACVLDRIERDCWLCIKGNHEDYVLMAAAQDPAMMQPWQRAALAHTFWTADRVRDLLPTVAALPDQISLWGPDGSEVRFVHASMRGNREGLYHHMDEAALIERTSPPADVLVAGHTHIPFSRRVDGRLIVNAGAAGLPFDGDFRPSYAILEWTPRGWTTHIRRITYDRAAAERDMVDSGFLDGGGPMARLILEELRSARPLLARWQRDFEPRVCAGLMTVEDSVDALLDSIGAR